MQQDSIDITLKEFCFDAYSLRLNEAIDSIPLYRLAQITGISRNTLKKYQTTDSTPDLLRLNQIAIATQYSLAWLLFGIPSTNTVVEE